MYLDTHDDHLWWLQRVLQYTHENQDSDKIELKVSQKIVSPILRACCQKKKIQSFRNPSQSTTEF